MEIADYLVNMFCFLLENLPYAVLLFQAYDRSYLRVPHWAMYAYYALIVAAGAVYPLSLSRFGDNGYRGIVFWGVVLLFFVMVRDRFTKKFMVAFIAYFCDNVQTVVLWAAQMVRALCQAEVLDEFYEQSSFPYDGFSLIVQLVTVLILFPVMLAFERRILKPYLRIVRQPFMWLEMAVMLAALVACALIISFYFALFSDMGVEYIWFFFPVGILAVTLLLLLLVLIFRASLMRARGEEDRRQMELMRENFRSVQYNIEHSRELYHDLRQLLRQIHTVSESRDIRELDPYIEKIVSLTEHTEVNFCENRCLNALLQYYTGCANERRLPIRISAVCPEKVGVSEPDLTILIANALENAIAGAEACRNEGEILVVVGIVANYLAIQISNPCGEVCYAPGVARGAQNGFLPAESYRSLREDGGQGLKRIQFIAEKYSGTAGFHYDAGRKLWTTRISLSIRKSFRQKPEVEG